MIQFIPSFFELFFVSHSIVNRVVDLYAVLDENKAKLGKILFWGFRVFCYILEIFLYQRVVLEGTLGTNNSGVNISTSRVLCWLSFKFFEESENFINWHAGNTLAATNQATSCVLISFCIFFAREKLESHLWFLFKDPNTEVFDPFFRSCLLKYFYGSFATFIRSQPSPFFKSFLILICMLEHKGKRNLGYLFGSLVLQQLFQFFLIEVKLTLAAILSRVCIEEFIDSILLVALYV